MPVRQRQALHPVEKLRLLAARRRRPPVAVEPRPAHCAELAHPLDREPSAALLARHCLDLGVDAGASGSLAARLAVSSRRKALSKKFSSSVRWPTARSRAATRARAASSSPAIPEARGTPGAGGGRGRPRPRSAATPPASYARRHSHSVYRGTSSSRLSAPTDSPACSRSTAASFNPRGRSIPPLCFDIRSLPSGDRRQGFPCLISRVQSRGDHPQIPLLFPTNPYAAKNPA